MSEYALVCFSGDDHALFDMRVLAYDESLIGALDSETWGQFVALLSGGDRAAVFVGESRLAYEENGSFPDLDGHIEADLRADSDEWVVVRASDPFEVGRVKGVGPFWQEENLPLPAGPGDDLPVAALKNVGKWWVDRPVGCGGSSLSRRGTTLSENSGNSGSRSELRTCLMWNES